MAPASASSGWVDGSETPQLFPRSQRFGCALAILARPRRRGPMRAYVTAAGMALDLMAVWAALVPFVA